MSYPPLRHTYRQNEISVSEAKELLRKWRENNVRRSKDIEYINMMVPLTPKNLGNEWPLVEEQFVYALLDCHNDCVYNIYALAQEFPGSLRVMRLKAAALEAEEKYDEAMELLDYIIEADETNAAPRKRKVAIYKAKGLIVEAIKELVDYLKKFMSDMEAWQELSELYLQTGEYARAAFCAEELLLHQPHNHLMHQRLADIRYTMGGVENLELAKSYYSHACKLNPDNIRALLGLVLTTNNLMNHYKSAGNTNKRKEVAKLGSWAQSQIIRLQQRAQKNFSNRDSEPEVDLSQALLGLSISE